MIREVIVELVDGPLDGRRVTATLGTLTPHFWVLLPDHSWARYVSQDELRGGALIYRYTPQEVVPACA